MDFCEGIIQYVEKLLTENSNKMAAYSDFSTQRGYAKPTVEMGHHNVI